MRFPLFYFKMYKMELRKNCKKYSDLSIFSNQLVHALAAYCKQLDGLLGYNHVLEFLCPLKVKFQPLILSMILEQTNSPSNDIKVEAGTLFLINWLDRTTATVKIWSSFNWPLPSCQC